MQNNSEQRRGGRKPQLGGGRGGGGGGGGGGGRGRGGRGRTPQGNGTARGFGRGRPVGTKDSDAPRSREEQFALLEKQREEQRRLQAAAKSGEDGKSSSNHAATDSDDDEEETTCLVCVEPMRYVSVGECNHPVCCALCTTRMRLIHNDRRCVLCKHDLERVFVTTNLSKRYEEFQTWGDVAGPGLAFDSTTGMFFEELYGGIDHLREIESLRELRCSVEGCVNPGPFATVGKLKAHLQEMHSLHLCKLCWESRGVFPMEQKLYTKPELDRHCAEGEPDTAFRGHPMCRFCKSRWYNKDGLYAHLKEKHESCHICQREGKPYEYYRNYDNLYKHFVKDHFVCTEPECIEAKFNVYASELELRGHIVKNHPHVRVDRTVPVQFDFGLRGGEGTRRGDGTGASSSNIDSFSFQYMPGHVGHPSMTNQQPLAAPSFDDSAFPTLQADDSSTGASGAGRGARGGGSQYHAALGANMNSSSVLNDASQFPSLGPSAGSSSNSIHALRPGQDFSNAVQLPYSSLNPVVQTKQGQKKKKGKGKKMAEAPRPVVMSAEQEMRETMRLSTQQGSRPAAAPMPAPAHAPAQVPRPAPSPVNRDFAERRTPYGVHPQADGAQWARPKGQTQQRRVGGAGEDFPSLPMGSAALGGARGATSATAQWDALRGSNQIKSGVMIGTRSQAAKQTKKKKPKKKPADPLFDFTGR